MIKVETSENVINSVKYLFRFTGRGMNDMRTCCKRTTDMLSIEQMYIQRGMIVSLPLQKREKVVVDTLLTWYERS